MTRPVHPLPIHLLLAFVALVSGLVSGDAARAATGGPVTAAAMASSVTADERGVDAVAACGVRAGMGQAARPATTTAAPLAEAQPGQRPSPVTRHDQALE